MKVLLTGFEPFGNQKINASWETIKKVKVDKVDLYKLLVPTVFYESINVVVEKIKEINPDIVILIGEAGGRSKISLERIGINMNDARIKDNEGNKPTNEKISDKGADGYFSTLDIYRIEKVLNENSIPVKISNTAGTFVCNHLLYGVLEYIRNNHLNIACGFIHLPYLKSQAEEKKLPYLDIDLMAEGIELVIDSEVKKGGYHE